MVFPEYGLSTLQIPANRTSLMAFLVPDPEIGENPCLLQEDTSPVMIRRLKYVYISRLCPNSVNF